ncbi:myricetin O-methyltransferase-like [Coffea arabica]|uniref:Myricetin O-methyltransferase-like n=1 Tax=Coffea arabica TaxID=13443 RepID=A0A6P6W1I5_COFAR|nr:probable O-methyltransferase 3 [Coffea arabica]
MEKVENLVELREAQDYAGSQIFNFRKSLKCAIELGIPDVIDQHGKPITLSDLISTLPINPSKSIHIHRLMRVLSNAGFFVQQNEAHGKNFWSYAAAEPQFGKIFNEAKAGDSSLIVEVVMAQCKSVFEDLTSLVDVGDGTGEFAEAIAQKFPNLECLVCDLPQLVANQQRTENLDFVAGNILEMVPLGDAILLKKQPAGSAPCYIFRQSETQKTCKIIPKNRMHIRKYAMMQKSRNIKLEQHRDYEN